MDVVDYCVGEFVLEQKVDVGGVKGDSDLLVVVQERAFDYLQLGILKKKRRRRLPVFNPHCVIVCLYWLVWVNTFSLMYMLIKSFCFKISMLLLLPKWVLGMQDCIHMGMPINCM